MLTVICLLEVRAAMAPLFLPHVYDLHRPANGNLMTCYIQLLGELCMLHHWGVSHIKKATTCLFKILGYIVFPVGSELAADVDDSPQNGMSILMSWCF